MPDSEKHKSRNVTDVPIVEELKTLVDILEHPQVSLDVERGHVFSEVVGVLENTQFDVCTASPVLDARFLVFRHKRKAYDDSKLISKGSSRGD
jgi:hypothetical protein